MFSLVPFSRRALSRKDDFWGFDRFFNNFFNDPFFTSWGNPVRADVRETDNEWLIDAEIPGVDKKDIQIELDDGYLTITVERKNEINEEKENYIRRERAYGSYRRCFYVDDVKEDDIKATYKDGILSLVIPKAKPTKKPGRKIDIL
jgi:HSP20 family protein